MIVGIDGGKPPKLVFAWRETAERWNTDGAPPAHVFSLAAAEKPEGVIRKGRTPASIVSPAGWGMAALFAVQAELRLWIPVNDWKNKLFPGRANVKKEIFCANIVQLLRLEGLDPKDGHDQDQIDAIGIAEAASRLTPKELKSYAVSFRTDPRTVAIRARERR